MTTIHTPPSLDIDLQIARIRNPGATDVTLNARQVLERRIVWNFLHHMMSFGWWVETVWDGEEHTEAPMPVPESDNTEVFKAVMEIVFNLDEVSLYFTNGDTTHHAYFVLGEGETILTDWSFADDDNFNEAVVAFSSEENMQKLL